MLPEVVKIVGDRAIVAKMQADGTWTVRIRDAAWWHGYHWRNVLGKYDTPEDAITAGETVHEMARVPS